MALCQFKTKQVEGPSILCPLEARFYVDSRGGQKLVCAQPPIRWRGSTWQTKAERAK